MKRIITVANRKGGVGKTTTVAAMASCLVRQGYRVLVIDLDSQCNLSSNLGADVKKKNILDVMLKKGKIFDAIQSVGSFDIIAGSLEFGKINDVLGNKTGREYRLLESLVPLKDAYDFCILDTPPELGLATANALTASDDVIITTTAESFSLDGVAQLYQSIREIRRYTNSDLNVAGILVTIYNPRTVLSKSMIAELESMASKMKSKLYNTTIRRSVAVAEAQNEEKDLFVYAQKSTTAQDYKKWVSEYLVDNIEEYAMPEPTPEELRPKRKSRKKKDAKKEQIELEVLTESETVEADEKVEAVETVENNEPVEVVELSETVESVDVEDMPIIETDEEDIK